MWYPRKPKPTSMTGAELRAIRDALGLYQTQIATELGVHSDVTISNYERGVYRIPETVAKMARALFRQKFARLPQQGKDF